MFTSITQLSEGSGKRRRGPKKNKRWNQLRRILIDGKHNLENKNPRLEGKTRQKSLQACVRSKFSKAERETSERFCISNNPSSGPNTGLQHRPPKRKLSGKNFQWKLPSLGTHPEMAQVFFCRSVPPLPLGWSPLASPPQKKPRPKKGLFRVSFCPTSRRPKRTIDRDDEEVVGRPPLFGESPSSSSSSSFGLDK